MKHSVLLSTEESSILYTFSEHCILLSCEDSSIFCITLLNIVYGTAVY